MSIYDIVSIAKIELDTVQIHRNLDLKIRLTTKEVDKVGFC